MKKGRGIMGFPIKTGQNMKTCWFDGDLAMKHRDFCQLIVDMGVSEQQDGFEIGNFKLLVYSNIKMYVTFAVAW